MVGAAIRTAASFALVALAGCTGNKTAPVQLPPAVVEVANPISKDVTNYQVFTARTQAPLSVQIKARVTGYLMKIDFQDGEVVKKGKVLFEIDDRPYKATLDKANADLKYAEAALAKAEAFYKIGLDVKKQNPAAVSDQELAKRLGERDEAAAQVLQAKAEIETAQLNYDWCKVDSPIDGRIDRHMVDVGTLVSENVTVLTNIVSITPIWAYFNVDQNSALAFQQFVKEGKIKSAREGNTPVDMGLTQDDQFPITGKIDFIANQLDPNTGSIQVRGSFANTDGSISSGLFARVKIPTSNLHPALLVLDRAIGTDQDRRYILVVNANNEVEYRPVQVGQMHGNGLREVIAVQEVPQQGPNNTTVTEKKVFLAPGDRVIINGLQRVRPGDKVQPKLVDMITMLPVTPEKK